MSDDKVSDKGDHISKNDEERVTEDKEVLKLNNLVRRKIRLYWKRIWWKESDGYQWWEGLWWKRPEK